MSSIKRGCWEKIKVKHKDRYFFKDSKNNVLNVEKISGKTWDIRAIEDGGAGRAIKDSGALKHSKKSALKFAKSYMKKHGGVC